MSNYIRDDGNGRHTVICPWDDEHTTGAPGDGSTVIYDGTDDRPQGFKCFHSHCAERSIGDVLKYFNVSLSESSVRKESGRSQGFDFKSLKDLFAEPEEKTPWLVDQLLVTGGTSLFASKPKAGKTTLSSQCAVAVARGEAFLGRETMKGVVLHLAVEEKKCEVIRRYREQGAKEDDQIYVHAASAPYDAVELLPAAIEQYKPSLVIVDTLFRVTPVENGNDYSQVTAALEPMNILARNFNVHIMMIHHMGKAERDGADGVLGSTAIQGAVDTILILNRTEKHRTLKSIQRYGVDLEETILKFDPETRRTSLGESKRTDAMSAMSDAILSALRERGSAMNTEDIVDAVGGNRGRIFSAIKDLVFKSMLLKSGKGGKQNPFMYTINPNFEPPGDAY